MKNKKNVAIRRAYERLKNRPSNTQPVTDSHFSDGPKSWGQWMNNNSLINSQIKRKSK
jgi:hypothetical protein